MHLFEKFISHLLVSLLYLGTTQNEHKQNEVRLTNLERLLLTGAFKGNAQFIFLCNPQKSGASRVCITFFK